MLLVDQCVNEQAAAEGQLFKGEWWSRTLLGHASQVEEQGIPISAAKRQRSLPFLNWLSGWSRPLTQAPPSTLNWLGISFFVFIKDHLLSLFRIFLF